MQDPVIAPLLTKLPSTLYPTDRQKLQQVKGVHAIEISIY